MAIIAATNWFRIVDTVGIRVAGEISEPISQRVVLRKVGRDRPYTVGVQLQNETTIRGACRYTTIKAAWEDFTNYADELVEVGYITREDTPKRKDVGARSDRLSLTNYE